MSHVQSVSKASTVTASDTLTLTGVTPGHSLLVALRLSGSSDVLTSFSDSIDGLIPRVFNHVTTTNTIRTYLYKKEACSGGDHVFTAGWSGSQSWRWIAAEYSESSIDVIDAAEFPVGSTSVTGPALTPTLAGGTLVGIVSLESSTSIAPNNSETERQEVNTALQLEDKAAPGLGPYSPAWLLGAARLGYAISLVMKGAGIPNVRSDHTAFRGMGRGMFRGF